MSEFVSGEEVKKLALLARIEISSHEVKKLQKDLGAILGYVSQLKKAPSRKSAVSIPSGVPTHIAGRGSSISRSEIGTKAPEIFNVFREDEPVIKPGEYTENLLKQAPDKERGFIKVKKIL